MKKILSFLVLVLALLGLVACGECEECEECEKCPEVQTSVESLSISGQKTEFKVGDTFEVGELVVKAKMSDDTETTLEADKYTVEQSADMNVPGTYAVLVKYEGQVAAYQIKVVEEVEEQYETIAEAVEAGLANSGAVVSGLVVTNTGETEYGFGNGFTFTKNQYEEYYYQLLEDESVFGVQLYEGFDGELLASYVYEPTTENLKGVEFSSVFGYEKTVFGAEDLLNALYETAKAETSFGLAEEIKKCADCGANLSYEFKFGAIVNGYLEYFTVKFALGAEVDFVSEIEVLIEGYYGENYTLNEETNEYSVNEGVFGADFINKVVVSQEAGERTAENPHKPENYIYESFDLVKDGATVEEGATFEVEAGNPLSLELANAKPEGVVAGVDVIELVITDAEGNETWNAFGGYDAGYVTVTAYQPGEYNVKVVTKNVEKSFKLNVAAAQLTYFAAGIVNDWYETEEVSEVNMFVNGQVLIDSVANENADKSYTAALKEGTENATLEFNGEFYAFSASVAGTYEVVLTSSVNAELTATLTVVVAEAPGVAEILVGTYKFESMMMGTATAEFTPESEGAEKGVVKIVLTGGMAGEANGTFNYEYTGGALVLTPDCPASAMSGLGLELDSDFNVCFVYNGWNQGVMNKEGATSGVEGLYVATMTHPMTGMALEYKLTLNADGTATYDFMNAFYYGACNYVVDGSTVTFSNFTAMLSTNDIQLVDAMLLGEVIACTFTCDADGTNIPLEFAK